MDASLLALHFILRILLPYTNQVIFINLLQKYCLSKLLLPGIVRDHSHKLLSRGRLFATPWTVTYQAHPSMGFSRKGYWSGLPFPSPGDLPNPGIEPWSPSLQADALPSELPGKSWMLLLLLLSCFSPVRLCATPQTAAQQASPSLGFSRQEHWSWLPFPSPMHESEK